MARGIWSLKSWPLILAVFALAASGEPESKLNTRIKVTYIRLPKHLFAVKYKLKLVPFIIPDNFSICGYAEVSFSIV